MNIGRRSTEPCWTRKITRRSYPWCWATTGTGGRLAENFPGRTKLAANSPDMKFYLQSTMMANIDRPLYYSQVNTAAWLQGVPLAPCGMVYRIAVRPEQQALNDWLFSTYSYRGLLDRRARFDEFTQRLVVDNYGLSYLHSRFLQEQGAVSAGGAGLYARLVFQKRRRADKPQGYAITTWGCWKTRKAPGATR